MLRKNAKIELIKRVPLFQRCSGRELAEVAALADEVDLPAGRELTSEGRTGREFVILVEGVADVTRKGKNVNELGPGDFLGEISLVTGRPRTATVTTRTPARLLVISAPAFRALLRDMPGMQAKVLEAVAERLPAD
ncbi:MAG TPA: cyclic nucleotide-binding domain-containing protein [Gaiellaceae bacterium]|nr:cyclic nucleotide-binding domain-containing protein [Gaiellaceae bacterium]